MKTTLIKIITLPLLIWNSNLTFGQEWTNLKSYQKETMNVYLLDGCWLKKDRKKQTDIWRKANKYNLTIINGDKKYKTISQIRDFYLWFDEERIKQGHEIQWIGIAAIAADQLSKLEIEFIRILIVRNTEVVKFANEGSKKVLAFAFPKLKKVYYSNKLIKGKDAENWDKNYRFDEQCIILDPLFKKLSDKAFIKLTRMMKGKGVFNLGVPKNLKFEGALDSCESRIDYGIKKILPHYLNKK